MANVDASSSGLAVIAGGMLRCDSEKNPMSSECQRKAAERLRAHSPRVAGLCDVPVRNTGTAGQLPQERLGFRWPFDVANPLDKRHLGLR